MNYVFVGGNFDKEGGRPSGLAAALNRGITSIWDKREGRVYNGGTLQELEAAAEMTRVPGIAVLWFANVPNDVPKTLVHSIKAQNQTCLLVTSKRVVEKKYDLMQVVQHALHLKSNLVLMFNRQGARYDAKLIDPLGNLFYASNDFTEMGRAIARRLDFLATVIRIRTERVEGTVPPVPAETGFFDYVRSAARRFSELLPAPKIVERFVGNAAFRCSFGFPAFREGELAFISRRNLDKELLGADGFVPVSLMPTIGTYRYYGEYKPSVDTPVQARLFTTYPHIKYLIHGHVYVSGAKLTDRMWPCGAYQEVPEIIQKVYNDPAGVIQFVVNLLGHGFIAGADDYRFFESLKFEARPFPETINPT